MSRPLVAVLLFVAAPFVFGDTYLVSSSADSGPGSLRQAILDANAHPGVDVISPSGSLFATIVLKSPLPVVTDTALIGLGRDPQPFAIDGRNAGAGADGFVFEADRCGIYGILVGGFSGAGVVFRGKDGSADGVLIGSDRSNALPNNVGIRIDPGANAILGLLSRVIVIYNHGPGIDIRGAADIRNAESSRNDGDGVLADGASSLRIVTLYADENGGNGLAIEHASNDPKELVQISYIGSANKGRPVLLDDAHGFSLTFPNYKPLVAAPVVRNSTGITINGTISNIDGDCVDLFDSEVTVSATISGCSRHGVSISGGTGTVTGSVTANGGDGVHVEHGAVVTVGTPAHADISNNNGNGIALLDHSSGSNLAAGTTVAHNGAAGVRIDQSSMNTVSVTTNNNHGGPVIISGSDAIGNSVIDAVIEGKWDSRYTGLSYGTTLGRAGVLITGGASNNHVTKTSIAFVSGPAVAIESGSGNRVDAITVASALHLPIDLGADGPSVGGATIAGGPNLLQPAPVIESVVTGDGGKKVITGLIPGSHGGTYDLDLYEAPDSEWNPLAHIQVQADAQGRFSGTLDRASGLVTATVTDAGGNTSEMSARHGVEGGTYLRFLPEMSTAITGKHFIAVVIRIGPDIAKRATAEWHAAVAYAGKTIGQGTLVFEPGEVRKSISIDTTPMAVRSARRSIWRSRCRSSRPWPCTEDGRAGTRAGR